MDADKHFLSIAPPYNKRVSTADVIIAGGGIIGLSTALELTRQGLHVTVLERGRAMTESSWAAAGMLAGRDPENPPELRQLSELSLSLYAGYLAAVENLSDLKVPLRTSRTLQGLNHHFNNAPLAPEIARLVPGLNIDRYSFRWLDEHSLDPRDLCRALPKAATAAGVTLVEESPVTGVHGMVSGIEVSTSQTKWSAASFINCCGAWAGVVSGLQSIEPCKGQMATMKLPPHLSLDCVIRTPELYIVPRGDGRVVIGASVEHAGFDKSVNQSTIQALLNEAAALWPPIREAQTVETWAGLRPGSSDGLPIIGQYGDENCWIASGHFRNGIMLAPATAQVMRELILNQQPGVDIEPFRCDRFHAATVS